MELQGSSVIVTGAARGIGLGIAQGFAGAGARVVLADLGSRSSGSSGQWAYRMAGKDDLETSAEALRQTGAEALALEVDVTDADSCQELIARSVEAFGGVDVLVNNAGLVKAGALASYDEADWDRLFAVNVKGIFLTSRAALEPLARDGGAILNIASIAGKQGYAGLGAYCASKFAVIGLTQSMALELAPAIRVNAICPGLLATAMWIDHLSVGAAAQTGKAPGRDAFEAFVEGNTPLGREQTPDDIADAALYLARADNVTGISVNVAGGTEMG